jgi:hypothetical protein
MPGYERNPPASEREVDQKRRSKKFSRISKREVGLYLAIPCILTRNA